MLGTNSGITGAAIGISTGALNPASSTLFGFFLIWIAGIMLIGTIDEKVTTEVLKKREKKAKDWSINQSTKVADVYTKAIKDTGKELSDLTDKEKLDVTQEIYKGVGVDYAEKFLGLKSTEYFGKARLKRLYLGDAKVSSDDIKNLAANLDLVSLGQAHKKGTGNVLQGLDADIFSDVFGNKKNIGYLANEFQAKLGIKESKVKTGEDVFKLYDILKGGEEDKKRKDEVNKILANYK